MNVKVCGYFYNYLKYSEMAGKTPYTTGALLLHLGAQVEINFLAQAIGGKYSYNSTLYDNEWILWQVGVTVNVRDFKYKIEETPTINMKRSIKN